MTRFHALVAEQPQPVACLAKDGAEALKYFIAHCWTVKGIMPITSSFSRGV